MDLQHFRYEVSLYVISMSSLFCSLCTKERARGDISKSLLQPVENNSLEWRHDTHN